MKDLEKEFKVLSELLRKAYDSIAPSDYYKTFLHKLFEKDVRNNLYSRHPKCYLTFRGKGREIPFFPICNMNGVHDPKVIEFSIKLAKKLKGVDSADQEHIDYVIRRLIRLYSMYTKDVPKPYSAGYLKGTTTKGMNKIKKYLSGE